MRRLLSYTAVGVAATAVHYGLLVLCVEAAGWPAPAATAFGAVVGAQVAFAGNRRLTFAHRGPIGRSWRRFQVTAGLGAGFGAALVWLGGRIGLHYLAAQTIATALGLLLTFAINRRWSFR